MALRGSVKWVTNLGPQRFLACGCFFRWWYPKMDGLTLLKWVIWGDHHFRKHPCKSKLSGSGMTLRGGSLVDSFMAACLNEGNTPVFQWSFEAMPSPFIGFSSRSLSPGSWARQKSMQWRVATWRRKQETGPAQSSFRFIWVTISALLSRHYTNS